MSLRINLILSQFVPISVVEPSEFRLQTIHIKKFARATVKLVIIKLPEIFEEKIRSEIHNIEALLSCDSWTINNAHYLRRIAIYMSKATILKKRCCMGIRKSFSSSFIS